MTPRCPHCHAIIPPLPSNTTRRAVVTAAWALVVALGFGAAVIGPFVILALPFMAFASIGVVAAAYSFADGDRICAACGRAYEIEGVQVAALARVIPAETAPSLAA